MRLYYPKGPISVGVGIQFHNLKKKQTEKYSREIQDLKGFPL
jgi:hypothetical protein